MRKTAFQQQQDLANLYCAQENSVIWDLYHANSKEFFLKKMLCLLPDYSLEGLHHSTEKYRNLIKENKRLDATRNTMTDAVWNQRKYSGGNLLTSLVFVLHSPNIYEKYYDAIACTNYTLYPLFRVRKCKRRYGTSENCCMIFVDMQGRVYQSWADFICTNTLPNGTIIVPQNGIYKLNSFKEVLVGYHLTPESSTSTKVLRTIDYTNVGLGLTSSLAIPVVAFSSILAPIAAPVILGCSIVGMLTGGWAIGRSSANIHDRRIHETSINITDREARSSWINIAGGIVGVGAAGMTQGLTAMSRTGRVIPEVMEAAVLGINGVAIGVNGISLGNNFAEIIIKACDEDEITSKDLLDLSTSLFLFTNSVCNFRTAKMLIKNINENHQMSFVRKLFNNSNVQNVDKMIIDMAKKIGTVQYKFDIIRSLKKFSNHRYSEDILTIMERINKNLIKPPENISNNISSSVNVSNNLISTNSSKLDQNIVFYIIDVAQGLMNSFFVGNTSSLIDVLLNIGEKLTLYAFQELIGMSKEFVREISDIMQRKFKIPVQIESIIWEIFDHILKTCGYVNITATFLRTIKRNVFDFIKRLYGLFVTNQSGEIECSTCGGFYTITKT